MAPMTPTPELDTHFSAPNATPTPWADVHAALRDAELFWISTIRPEGRPHVTPLPAVWHDMALYLCTGPQEQKAVNLRANPGSVAGEDLVRLIWMTRTRRTMTTRGPVARREKVPLEGVTSRQPESRSRPTVEVTS